MTTRPARWFSLCLALAALAFATPAWADDATVPDVTGKTQADAVAALDGAGFGATVVEIAGPPVGKVEKQVPSAGASAPAGSQVMIRVGTAVHIETTAPDARGMTAEDAIAAYESAYVIEVQSVSGPASDEGKVQDQSPAPGATLLYRGVLTLDVVSNEASIGSATVPSLIGKQEAAARQALEAAGLVASIVYVADPAASDGTVVSQDPHSGTEIIAGGTVFLRVVGAAPPPVAPTEPESVEVPDVVGLTMHEAAEGILAAGLVAHTEFHTSASAPAWTCDGQDPAAGTSVQEGATVRIRIAIPGAASQVRVPSLFGLQKSEAVQVLGSLHLSTAVSYEISNFTAGEVFAQNPAPGTWVSTGEVVHVVIAQTPPGGWTPQGVHVPNVVGLSPGQAFFTLLQHGLLGKLKHRPAPDQPLDVVEGQLPAAGTLRAPGSLVYYYLPETTTVPNLIGKTKGQAVQLLQGAHLNAQAQGPNFGIGTTKVTAQSAPPGQHIAKGSTVSFHYVYSGPILPIKVAVPNLIGKTKQAAGQLLQAAGLHGAFSGPAFGLGTTSVTFQNPAAGTLVFPGSTVNVNYVFQPVVQILKVHVPDLTGKTKAAAQQLLQAQGLNVNFQGPAFGFGVAKVVSQSPAAGTLVFKGSTVTANYVWQMVVVPNPPLLLMVKVPSVVGMSVAAAKNLLLAKGLKVQFVGPAFGFGVRRVISQNPAANVMVVKGSTVTMHYKYGL
jgi:beta-lactam-binding protein with PASTA domain